MGSKTNVWRFQATNWQDCIRECLVMTTKRKPKREIESLLISAQNNAKKTNYIKAKINNVQQNSNCRLCGDKDKTVHHMIIECSQLAQKEYKTRHDWIGKMIHWELCEKVKFDHITKWYIQ